MTSFLSAFITSQSLSKNLAYTFKSWLCGKVSSENLIPFESLLTVRANEGSLKRRRRKKEEEEEVMNGSFYFWRNKEREFSDTDWTRGLLLWCPVMPWVFIACRVYLNYLTGINTAKTFYKSADISLPTNFMKRLPNFSLKFKALFWQALRNCVCFIFVVVLSILVMVRLLLIFFFFFFFF